MSSFSDWIAAHASARAFMVLLTGALMVMVLFRITRASLPEETLDGRSFYRPGAVHEILGRMGEEGRGTYLWTEATIDMAFPPVYAALLAVWFSLALRRAGLESSRLSLLNLVPPAAAAADYLENLTVVALLIRFDAEAADVGLGIAAAAFSALKGGLLAASILAPVGIVATGLIRRARRR